MHAQAMNEILLFQDLRLFTAFQIGLVNML